MDAKHHNVLGSLHIFDPKLLLRSSLHDTTKEVGSCALVHNAKVSWALMMMRIQPMLY